ncbi:MAG: hypothetical protein K2N06_01465 [Oscillospiraceae bacterium]|nr:hypothetical protein [Oscillospiraceae bacterium]
MRITNSTILRGYNRDLNRILSLKNATEHRITTNRRFSRASESPLAAAKALTVRKSLYYNEQYTENLKTANEFYTEAETSLLQVSEKMAQISETIVAACNTTKDIVDYNIYAQQLETSARELCAIFNTDSAGRTIFGGESNDSMPFAILDDSSGSAATVTYHGIPVNAMSDYREFPYSANVNLDIGLGMVTNQSTHEIDDASVLRISFNGAKVSGCGAEYGVADIDLSSVQKNRTYSLDVYAGNVKKTINFVCSGETNAEKVAQINAELDKEFAKTKAYGEPIPHMDEQGVIYLADYDDGNFTPVENGICSVVNNEYAKRTSKVTVDNDSGYTNKFKVNVESLTEGQTYTLDVTVGDTKKTISFVAAVESDALERDKLTIENIQSALNEAFPGEDVSISKSGITKGIISAEGKNVKVLVHDPMGDVARNTVNISSTSQDKINLKALKDGETYKFCATVNGKSADIEFTAGADANVTAANIKTALQANTAFTGMTFDVSTSGDKIGTIATGGNPVSIAKTSDSNSVSVSSFPTYSIDANSAIDGVTYKLKVMYGTSVRDIEFTGGADKDETIANINKALENAFGTGAPTVADDGKITAGDTAVVLSNSVDTEKSVVERERIYSNNYIQLTLDAARALRNGDIGYANGCLDRIATAKENLLAEIADMGCNEEFIDFNLTRITTRSENLSERQNDLEVVDAKKEITLWKTYEAMYNACLQMSSSVVPNSIFNYIK